jgi:outer membrane protein assembly factor BamB
LAVGCLLALAGDGVLAQEWTRFRGPNGAGTSPVTTVPVRWTDKDFAWKVAIPGVGHSSPVVWAERVFVTSGDEATGQRSVLCFRAGDGKQLWGRSFAAEPAKKHEDSSLASATPAVDERHIYVSWASARQYVVLALDHAGKEIWRIDLGPFRSGYGLGASLIVHDGIVVAADDQDGPGALVGLDSGSGKVRWRIPRKSQATYTTPCVLQRGARPAELIFTNWDRGITSIDPKTGKQNWEADVFSKGHVETAIGSPIVAGSLVLGTCGWLGVKTEVVAVRPPNGMKDARPEVVYRIERGAPLVTTPLVTGDLLFLWSDEGIVTCADVATGKVYWRERVPGSYYGSPVCVGNNLFCVSRDGTVVVLAAAKEFAMLARNRLGEGSHSTPAVADGTLYFRTFSHLMALRGKKTEAHGPRPVGSGKN